MIGCLATLYLFIIFCFRPTLFTVNVVCNVFHDDPNEDHKLKLFNIEQVLLEFSQCTNNRHNMKPVIVVANRFLHVLPNWQLREKASSAKSHSPK